MTTHAFTGNADPAFRRTGVGGTDVANATVTGKVEFTKFGPADELVAVLT